MNISIQYKSFSRRSLPLPDGHNDALIAHVDDNDARKAPIDLIAALEFTKLSDIIWTLITSHILTFLIGKK